MSPIPWTELSSFAPDEPPAVRALWLRRLYLLGCFVCLSAFLGVIVSVWGDWAPPRVEPVSSGEKVLSVDDVGKALEVGLEAELRSELKLRTDD